MLTRRSFVKSSAAVAAVNLMPRNVIAGSGTTPPSERIAVAAIGCAGRPVSNICGLSGCGCEIIGLCDVDTSSRTEAMRKKFPQAQFWTHYREMLDTLGKKIDAVTIGTPDFWHPTMAIECLKRGYHVQCEKPLSQSYHEIDGMIAAAKASGKVTQAMNQGHAFDSIRDFREWVEAGIIGDVKEIHFWSPGRYSRIDYLWQLAKHYDVPKTLDWNQWQGPVPHREYKQPYLPGSWRFWSDYGTSALGDWACHLMDPVFWTFSLGEPEAVTVDFTADWDPVKHHDTFPRCSRTTWEFAAGNGHGPLILRWYDGAGAGLVPVPKEYDGPGDKFPTLRQRTGAPNWFCPDGAIVYGTKGVINYGSHGAKNLTVWPLSRMKALKEQKAFPPKKYARVKGGSPYSEFVGAIKGGPAVGSDFTYAGGLTKTALLAIAAMFDPGKRLIWDAKAQRFTNSEVANARVHMPRLAGW